MRLEIIQIHQKYFQNIVYILEFDQHFRLIFKLSTSLEHELLLHTCSRDRTTDVGFPTLQSHEFNDFLVLPLSLDHLWGS